VYISFSCDQSDDAHFWSKHAAYLRTKYCISLRFDWIYSVSVENILTASDAICRKTLTTMFDYTTWNMPLKQLQIINTLYINISKEQPMTWFKKKPRKTM